jgi:hypothetical protein
MRKVIFFAVLLVSLFSVAEDPDQIVRRVYRKPAPAATVDAPSAAIAETQKPPRTFDRKFALVAGATMASAAFDAWSTNRNLDHGYLEQNLILGSRPAKWNVWALTMGEAAAWNTVAYVVKKKTARHPNPWVRRAWMFFPALSFGGHMYGGIHNVSIYDPVKYPRRP